MLLLLTRSPERGSSSMTHVHAVSLIPRLGKGLDKPSPSLLSTQPLPGWNSELPTHLPSPFKVVLHTAHSCRLISNFCQELRES